MPNPRLKSLIHKDMTRKEFLAFGALAAISIFGFIGVIEELLSHAATSYTTGEASSGTRGGTTSLTTATGSASTEVVKFGTSSGGGGGTGTNMLPVGPTGTYKLVWNDEFDDSAGSSGLKNGLLNTKWNIGNNVGPSTPGGPGVQNSVSYGPNSDDGDYHGPGTVKLPGDGSVHLQGIGSTTAPDKSPASYETYDTGEITTAGLMALNPASTAIPDATLSAAISAGKVTVVNGPCAFEVRMRIQGPNQSGANLWWPVIWMSNGGNFNGGSGTNWPGGKTYLVEQDYWEWYYSPNGTVGGANAGEGEGGTFSMPISPSYDGAQAIPDQFATTDMSLDFHTYTVAFTAADSLTLYVDGIQTPGFPLTNSNVAANQKYPFFLIIALQSHMTGRSLPDTYNPVVEVTSNPPDTTAPGNNDMMIDYVRVWSQS